MARPFTFAQARENAAFLEGLRRTGNARLAARSIGRRLSTMIHRRGGHAGFAQDWEAAVAAAHARFFLAGGRRGPEGLAPAGGGAGEKGRKGEGRIAGKSPAASPPAPPPRSAWSPSPAKAGEELCARGLRTVGGEAVVVRTRNGRLQLRFAQPGKLTKAAEQVFLAALSATANVRLSAAAAGASPRAFYRRYKSLPAFAREFRLALRMGYERLEAASLMSALPESHEDDQWRHAEPPPIPPMSASQALQLLYLHEKSVCQRSSEPHRRRRRNESDERYRMRLFLMWRSEQRQIAEEQAVARAERFEAAGSWRFEDEAAAPELPPLHLVTGWSKADPAKKPHDPELALFGGWRLKEMKKKLAGKG